MTKQLTELRAADRARMAAALCTLATRYGATADIDDGTPGEVNVDIQHPSGLCVCLVFERRSSQPDTHVIPWHVRRGPRRLAPTFGIVNSHHGLKATHVAYGWLNLRAEIDRGLAAAADGSAFTPEAA